MDPETRAKPPLQHSKSALYQAAQAAVADQRTKASERSVARGPRSRTPLRLAMVLLILAGGGALALRPSWLVGPTLPEETPAIRTASATLALIDAIARVNAFAAAAGRLPGTLGEAGVANPAIGYRPLGAHDFEVTLQAGDSTVTLRPSSPIEALASSAIHVLQRRT